MMKQALIVLLFVFFIVRIVNAAEVCVVVDYGEGSEKRPDGKCISIEEGRNGYELLNKTGWDIEWKYFGYSEWAGMDLGHGLCKMNNIGNDPTNCFGTDNWMSSLAMDGEWFHLLVGYDTEGGCWNRDKNSGIGHYCTKDGDIIGLAYGGWTAQPEMFKVNITKVYVDDEKQKKVSGGGKVKDIPPNSTLRLKIELENLYDSSTEIDVNDISIEAVIEEIDNGNDIEAEIEDFDLEADKKTTKELEFKVPLEVEAKDRLLRIEIKGKDNAGIKYEKEFRYDLEIEKEEHKLEITKAKLNKDSYKCGENALLELSILNIGLNNEDVKLKIENRDLKLDINEEFRLSNKVFKETSKYEKGLNVWLPSNIEKATYPIAITASYGAKKETANLNLVVGECEKEIAKEGEKNIDTQTGKISEGKEIETEKKETEKGVTTIEGKINRNLPFVLMFILGLLIALIITFLVIFWVVRK